MKTMIFKWKANFYFVHFFTLPRQGRAPFRPLVRGVVARINMPSTRNCEGRLKAISENNHTILKWSDSMKTFFKQSDWPKMLEDHI